jgi:predicted RNA-binding Zn-ribbon protein involved in translation (DUF1610 family)
MAENTTNYQCPACTGPLRFDSASGKLCCDYCGSTYDVAQVEALYGEKQAQADKAAEAAEKAASSGPVWGEMETGDLSSRTCTSCGAELVCGPETAATTCPYCGNPTVLGGQLSGKLKPEYIIPFRMDKKTAIENLKKYYKGKAFLPKAFKESNHIEEIQGVYVPFWLYDGRMEARGAYKAEISESHREGDYIVTTTRHFVRFSRYCRIRLLLCRLCRFRRKRFDLRRCLHQLRHQLADRFQVKPLFLQFPDSQKNLNVLRSIAAVSQRIAVDFHAELVLPVPEHMRFLPGQLLRLRDQIRSIFHTAATPFFPLL